MTQPVRDAYASRVAEYIQVCGTIETADPRDRDLVASWARDIDGPIVDVGCGPGQWTAFLHDDGASVVGVDPVPEFIDEARRRYPDAHYAVGRAGALDFPPGSKAGILAWFSLIHVDPAALDPVLDDVARVLKPGGRLLVGFFEGPELVRFEHKVYPAWYWPTADLTRRLDAAGFSVVETRTRMDPASTRSGGSISAVLRARDDATHPRRRSDPPSPLVDK
ncbi:putative methyltransferase [Gordonia araii NBRC 100433]|uniref:Putative methyltransferase n=1 Tax=Gordonia araii NBRC 100433 TaxID=1073574 RepID=G7H1I8_9ACTN|nr:class I SAM-dependent methyltransferase [Gordonia araii]GAB09713.1 putative methyltransferase [Gordonia araii NBRC 100433]